MRHKRKKLALSICMGFLVIAGEFLPTDSAQAAATGKGYSVSDVAQKMVKKGKNIFEENCVMCHQEDGIGLPGTAPSLTNPELLSLASNNFLKQTIRDGRPGTSMVSFDGSLSEDDIAAVVAYLRSMATLPFRGEQVDAEPDAHGNEHLGKQWFADICATCHGVNGDGYSSGGTGTAIGKAGFLSTVSDGFLRETIRSGRSNTRMRGLQGPAGLANLTDREIDDIITYLRTVPSKDEE
ncbi:MAG: c-type cytochrome [Magnetococcales bacterium]|nr:c-type cytochrome [Magnetococcales bacterium]